MKVINDNLNNNKPPLPKGWVWTRLGEVLNVIKGKKPSRLGEKTDIFIIPYINIEAFEKKIFTQYTNDTNVPMCNKNDVLIVWDGARCGLVGTGVSGAIGSTLAKLSCPEIHNSYLFYFLKSQYDEINKRPKGVGIPHVDPNVFYNIYLPLPPLPEQHRIVAKIEELFTKLDAGVEALKKVKAQIKRYRQAVLKYAFEGKLTAQWRARAYHDMPIEPASALLEKIKIVRANLRVRPNPGQNGKTHRSAPTEELPELPEGWVWVRLTYISEKINPGFPSGKHNKEAKGVPHIRPMNINMKGEIDLSEVKYVQPEFYEPLKKGDVLFNNTNSPELLGKTAYIKIDTNWAYSNHMTRIRLNFDFSNPAWIAYCLHYLFLSGFFKMHCTHHVNQASINSTFLAEKVILPLPPLPEQHKIVEEIERRFSIADSVEKIVDQSLKQAERLRQSILKQAFKGKLVPQDPNDEPAEKLLERIKSERESSKNKRVIHELPRKKKRNKKK